MKNYHYFSLLIILGGLFTSCKEDPPLPFCAEFPEQCAEIRGVKDYFYFTEGTWWVYEEETSGERDSVYVTSAVNDLESYQFRTETYSTYNEYEYNYWSFGGVKDDGFVEKEGNSLLVKLAKTKPGDFVSESYCFIYYPAVGNHVASSSGGAPYYYNNQLLVHDFKTIYTYQEDSFENVVVMTEEHTASEEKQPTVKFYAEKVGLIRKELLDSNQVWNLVNFNISQ
jgi:hypothetical protein